MGEVLQAFVLTKETVYLLFLLQAFLPFFIQRLQQCFHLLFFYFSMTGIIFSRHTLNLQFEVNNPRSESFNGVFVFFKDVVVSLDSLFKFLNLKNLLRIFPPILFGFRLFDRSFLLIRCGINSFLLYIRIWNIDFWIYWTFFRIWSF